MTNEEIGLVISFVGVCATVAIAYFLCRFTKVSVTQSSLDSLQDGIKEIDPILTTKVDPMITPIPIAAIKEEQEKGNNTIKQ